ncbi:MAG: YebC/PmpR family DNA-binding transcriptional regulator [Candidatus Sungbacteria bacterium]|uniref:Probable transcriptional regulatory protein HY473_00255 n=1 Tax=Candidatus Sungiibacteriota bacterium TaxID=2750080 RepID=A0A932YYF4_9BACT|nr:YebC/PmpR family DNA-binding transcriptional regulator [Candidatus Sungbacteria bacterium]
MAGHSRWAQIRHKKAGADAKRGALFSKLARLIAVAARDGGGDPARNSKLRQAMDQARDAGVPKENIERAILRGTGGGEMQDLRAVEYEAYGPGGIALLIAGLTDNPNRTTSEIKKVVNEFGGRLVESGGVAWMFRRCVIFEFDAPPEPTEAVELVLIDAGALDTYAGDGSVQALVALESCEDFQKNISSRGLSPRRQYLTAVAQNPVQLESKDRALAEAVIAALEEHPDITAVWTTLARDSA